MKKLAIALLALCMVLTTVLVPILADNEETVIGYSAARIKKADLTEVKNIKDYDKDNVDPAYKITDAEGLVKFSELVNGGQSFESCFIYLAKDINMEDVEDFKPIGSVDFTVDQRNPEDHETAPGGITLVTINNNKPFKGTFNGHGHVIDNLVINVSSDTVLYAGFFGFTDTATISNLVLGDGCSLTHSIPNEYAAAGGLTGKSSGTTIENVYNGMAVTTPGPHAAGFVGRGNATIRNSTNAGDMEGKNSVAGFTGFNEGVSLIENCRNTGTMTGAMAAGISSRLRGQITVKNSINNGTINGSQVVGGIGGLADRADNADTFENCINYGVLNKTNDNARVNGIATADAKYGDTDIAQPIITNCEDKYVADSGVATEDPSYEALTFTCNPDAEEDGAGDGVTAFVTTEKPFEQEIGVNTNPTGDEIGYSSARIEEVDTKGMIDIKNYEDYPDEDFYKITDAEGFLVLDQQLYNYATFSTVTLYLANDIDMSKISGFQPISYDIEHIKHVNGTPRYYFAGTLDGQGEAICNLVMHSKEEPLKFDAEGKVDMTNGTVVSEALVCVGLFGCAGGTYMNLIIDETCEFSYVGPAANPCVAALIAKTSGGITVDNCWFRASISGGRFNGAISGRPSGRYEIKNTTVSGDIKGASIVGGFTGFDGAGGRIENCRNVANIERVGGDTSFYSGCGGFVARARASITIVNSINNGNVTAAANPGAFFGTIRADQIIENCTNYGVITATKLPDTAGIAFGVNESATVEGVETIYGSVEEKVLLDKSGQQDPSLMFEKYEINFTPEEHVETSATETSATEETTVKTTATTKVTTAGGNDGNGGVSTTKAPADDEPIDEEKGCSSTVIGSMAVVMIVCGAAVTLFKKKED